MTDYCALSIAPNTREVFQRAALELLQQAVERGDQDPETLAWAVGYLLRRAANG